jgi:hypothetical protein
VEDLPRDLKPPFKFDISSSISRLRKLPVSVDGVTINLPGVKVTLKRAIPDRVQGVRTKGIDPETEFKEELRRTNV